MMIVKSGDGSFFLSCATCVANSASVKLTAFRVALAIVAARFAEDGRPTHIVSAKRNVRINAILGFRFIAITEIWMLRLTRSFRHRRQLTGIICSNRQLDLKRSPLARRTFDVDRAAVKLDDLTDN